MAEVEARAARLEYERDQQGRLAVAAERNRIAREMHDIVAHNLSVMIALNDGASFTLRTDPGQGRRSRTGGLVGGAYGPRRTATCARRAACRRPRRRRPCRRRLRAPAPKIADLDPLLVPIRRTGLDVTLTIEGPVGRAVARPATHRLPAGAGVAHQHRQARRSAPIGRASPSAPARRAPRSGSSTTGRRRHRAAPARAGSGQGIIGMHERAAGHGGRVDDRPTATGWMVRAWFPLETPDAPLRRRPNRLAPAGDTSPARGRSIPAAHGISDGPRRPRGHGRRR